jgi:hypothetical protein
MNDRSTPCRADRAAARARRWFAIGLSLALTTGGLTPASVHGAPEVDRDAYWVESTICTVSIRGAPGSGPAEAGQSLGTLAAAPAHCTGNMTTQIVPGGVNTLLQRGFRIKTAHHQIAWLPLRGEGDPTLLVTGLFALERPALRPPPIPR